MPAPGLRREDRDKQAVADRVDQRLDTRCCRASDHGQRLVEPRQRTCHEQRSSRHGPPRCLAPARAPAQQRRRGAAGRRKGGGSKMAATSRASAGRGAVHSAQRKGQKGERRCLVGSRKARAPPAEGAGGAWSIVGASGAVGLRRNRLAQALRQVAVVMCVRAVYSVTHARFVGCVHVHACVHVCVRARARARACVLAVGEFVALVRSRGT